MSIDLDDEELAAANKKATKYTWKTKDEVRERHQKEVAKIIKQQRNVELIRDENKRNK